jgi:hypothetical protein
VSLSAPFAASSSIIRSIGILVSAIQFSAAPEVDGNAFRARGFLRAGGQHTFFDVKFINPNLDIYITTQKSKVNERAEKNKRPVSTTSVL